MINLFHEWPVGSIIFIYMVIRTWSFFVTSRMLNTILRSSVGKKSDSYTQTAPLIQRLYGTYIPLVTSYRHMLSKYLALNNLICAGCTGVIIVMAVISIFLSIEFRCILEYCSMFAIISVCIPPIIVSFFQTSWIGGHPHYWFDLESQFIGVNAKRHKRLLLDEKQNSVLLTPEEYVGQRRRFLLSHLFSKK